MRSRGGSRIFPRREAPPSNHFNDPLKFFFFFFLQNTTYFRSAPEERWFGPAVTILNMRLDPMCLWGLPHVA